MRFPATTGDGDAGQHIRHAGFARECGAGVEQRAEPVFGPAPRLRFGRFIGTVSAEENTYYLRAFEALGLTETRRAADSDTQPTIAFKVIMREAADTRTYAAALSVLVVAEWLYLDWASRAPQPLPNNFVHAEWITLHDNPNFRGFVDFLRTELDRIGPAHADLCRDFFSRAVALELSFFEAAYTT